MNIQEGYQLLREVVEEAKTDKSLRLDFVEETNYQAGFPINQLHVIYQDGNEYLNLKTLINALETRVELVDENAVPGIIFEYRGRGAQESPKLVAELVVRGERFQLIYFLDHESADQD